MKRYLASLNENVSNQVLTDLDAIDVRVVWVSEALPHIVSIETNTSLEELKNFFLIESIQEETTGTVDV